MDIRLFLFAFCIATSLCLMTSDRVFFGAYFSFLAGVNLLAYAVAKGYVHIKA